MKRRKSSELKSMAREALCGNYGTFIGTSLIYGIIALLLSCIPAFAIPTNSSYLMVALRFMISFLIGLIVNVLAAGLSRIALNISRKQPVQIGDLFHAFRHHPDRFLILGLILSLISNICMIPGYILSFTVTSGTGDTMELLEKTLCMSLLSLAGSILYIVLTLALSMSTMLLVDYDDISAMEALKESVKMMRGNKWRYFYITTLSFLGLILISVFGLYIPLLWILPYIYVTQAFFYRELNQEI